MNTAARAVTIRAAIFFGLLVISIPLAYPVGMAIIYPLTLLAPSPLPDTQFWSLVDDLVFDVPANWPYIVLAPALGVSLEGPYVISYSIPVAFWAIIGVAYAWVTRRIRTLYSALGVLPVIYEVGGKDDAARRELFLQAANRHCLGGAVACFRLPLSRVPAKNRQRLWSTSPVSPKRRGIQW